MNKFRKKSLLMILLILIIVVISGVSLYSAYNVRKDKDEDVRDNNKSTVINKDNEEAIVKEENDNTRINKSLDRSIAVINHLYTSLSNRITNIYKGEINISDVERNYKIYSVLLYLYDEKQYDPITEEDYNRLYEGLYMEEKKDYYGSMNFEDVSDLYKKVYNEALESGMEISIDTYCPTFKFDNNKYYFGVYDCQKQDTQLRYYNFRYVIGDESADVYTSLGVLEHDFTFKTYKYDLYKEVVFEESETDLILDINDSNRDAFSQYIVHFVKEKGDYYVTGVRKVMD